MAEITIYFLKILMPRFKRKPSIDLILSEIDLKISYHGHWTHIFSLGTTSDKQPKAPIGLQGAYGFDSYC